MIRILLAATLIVSGFYAQAAVAPEDSKTEAGIEGDYISDTALEKAFVEDLKQLGAELDTLEMALPARKALPRQKKSKRADAGTLPTIKN